MIYNRASSLNSLNKYNTNILNTTKTKETIKSIINADISFLKSIIRQTGSRITMNSILSVYRNH